MLDLRWPHWHLSPLEHAAFVVGGLLLYVLVTRIGHQRHHPSAALAWVLSITAFPYLAVPLFLLFGTRKFSRPTNVDRLARHLGSGRSLQSADLASPAPEWVASLLRALDADAPSRNRSVAFHRDGAESLTALLALCDQSQRRLDVATYVLGDDEVGLVVVERLALAAARGVRVRLLVDALGSLATRRTTWQRLAASGVEVRRFMPLLHNPRRGRTNLRNHRKLAVADGRLLWSGGRNIAAEYFIDRPSQPAWIDLSFEVEGPLARTAQRQFGRDWLLGRPAARAIRHSRPRLSRRLRNESKRAEALDPVTALAGRTSLEPYAAQSTIDPHAQLAAFESQFADGSETAEARPPVAAPLDTDHRIKPWTQWIASGPDRPDDTLYALLLAAAYHARQRITVVTPYFVPDDALLDAWCLASRRGVQVTLVVPLRSNHRLADLARGRALRRLAACGAHIRLPGRMVHAKAVVIDDGLALCGSANLDGRSLFLNYEAMVAFYGKAQIDTLSTWIDQLVATSGYYVPRPPSLLRDTLEGMVRTVGFQL